MGPPSPADARLKSAGDEGLGRLMGLHGFEGFWVLEEVFGDVFLKV